MTNTIQESLHAAKLHLSVITDNPSLEAEILLAYTLQRPRSFLLTWPENILNENELNIFSGYLRRRCNKEPIAYITGCREFWSLDLLVTKDTLIPRPETELLVQSVLEIGNSNKLYSKQLDFRQGANERVEGVCTPYMTDDEQACTSSENSSAKSIFKVADLGTGSGAIGLALAHEKPSWQIYATDASESALAVARNNAQRLALENIYFYHGNWCTALPCKEFNMIVSNPPYIAEIEWEKGADGLAFEPRMALVSPLEGLEAIQTISQSAKLYLQPMGYLLIEHGYLQGAAVRKIFAASGYSQIRSVRDLADHERVTIGQYQP